MHPHMITELSILSTGLQEGLEKAATHSRANSICYESMVMELRPLRSLQAKAFKHALPGLQGFRMMYPLGLIEILGP